MSSRTTSERRRTLVWSAPSGTSTRSPPSDAATRRGPCSKASSPPPTARACSPSTWIRAPGSSGATSSSPTAWSASSARRSGCRGGGISGSSPPALERQPHPVRPSDPILRGILAPTRPPPQVDHVVLLRHLARRLVGAPVQGEPAVARARGQVGAPVTAYPFDRQPFERGPSVRGIPLLTGGDQCGHEPARLQELPREPRRHRPPLLRRGEPEVQRSRRRDGGAIRHPRARLPAHVVEVSRGGIVRGPEQRPTPVLGRAGEPLRDLPVARSSPDAPQRGDRHLGMIQETVQVHRDELRRFQRPQIFRVAHPAAREVPAAFRRGPQGPIQRVALPPGNGLRPLVVGAVRLRPGLRPGGPATGPPPSLRQA